jgi:hypothetical protein
MSSDSIRHALGAHHGPQRGDAELRLVRIVVRWRRPQQDGDKPAHYACTKGQSACGREKD